MDFDPARRRPDRPAEADNSVERPAPICATRPCGGLRGTSRRPSPTRRRAPAPPPAGPRRAGRVLRSRRSSGRMQGRMGSELSSRFDVRRPSHRRRRRPRRHGRRLPGHRPRARPPVALKLIAPELAPDPVFRARFERECRLAAAIDHPHAVEIFHAGEEDGLLYVTMRYVDGTDLRAHPAPSGPARAGARGRASSTQVAGALDEAHRRGLVHRDVKPGNILVARASGDEHAFLTDFGAHQERAADAELTRTGLRDRHGRLHGARAGARRRGRRAAPTSTRSAACSSRRSPARSRSSATATSRRCGRTSTTPPPVAARRPARPAAPRSARWWRSAMAKQRERAATRRPALRREAVAGARARRRRARASARPARRCAWSSPTTRCCCARGSRRARGRRLRGRRRRPATATSCCAWCARTGPTWPSSTSGCRRRTPTRGCGRPARSGRSCPGMGVLVLSQYVEMAYAVELLGESAEGVGYLLKDRVADGDSLANAVRQVGQGGSALDPEVVARMLVARRRRGPARQALAARARGAGADGRGPVQPGDRRELWA